MEKQVRKERATSLPMLPRHRYDVEMQPRCKMCFRSERLVLLQRAPDLPVEILHCLIDELFPTAITPYLFSSTIGEPLMSPYIDKIPDACAAYQQLPQHHDEWDRDEQVMTSSRSWRPRFIHIAISVDSVTPSASRPLFGRVISQSPAKYS